MVPLIPETLSLAASVMPTEMSLGIPMTLILDKCHYDVKFAHAEFTILTTNAIARAIIPI